MNEIRAVLVIDIDDTLFVHTSNQIEYSKIRPDNGLKAQLQRIQVPKFILTNATFEHANTVLNKMDVIDDRKCFEKSSFIFFGGFCNNICENR